MAQHPLRCSMLFQALIDSGDKAQMEVEVASLLREINATQKHDARAADVSWGERVGSGTTMRWGGAGGRWWKWLEMVGTCWKTKITKGISQRNMGTWR